VNKPGMLQLLRQHKDWFLALKHLERQGERWVQWVTKLSKREWLDLVEKQQAFCGLTKVEPAIVWINRMETMWGYRVVVT